MSRTGQQQGESDTTASEVEPFPADYQLNAHEAVEAHAAAAASSATLLSTVGWLVSTLGMLGGVIVIIAGFRGDGFGANFTTVGVGLAALLIWLTIGVALNTVADRVRLAAAVARRDNATNT